MRAWPVHRLGEPCDVLTLQKLADEDTVGRVVFIP